MAFSFNNPSTQNNVGVAEYLKNLAPVEGLTRTSEALVMAREQFDEKYGKKEKINRKLNLQKKKTQERVQM